MTEEEIIELIRHTIMLCIELSMPVMMVGLIVGTAVALVQALTQIQETTLVFVPKVLSIFLALFVALPMMATTLIDFMNFLADKIIAIK
jgi:flagellar biosynthetic protein FliQ